MRCATWTDHEWSERRIVGAGRHPQLGPFYCVERRCERCDATTSETRWTERPAPKEVAAA